MPSTRRALLGGAAAALAGCLGTSGGAPTAERSSSRPTGSPTSTASSTPASGPATTTRDSPSPTTRPVDPLDPVEGAWPSFAMDAANTGHQPDGRGPADRPRVRWHAPVGTVFGAPVVGANRVFVGQFGGGVLALDARTGEVAWRRELPPPSGSLVVADGTVFALTVDGASGGTDALHALAVEDGRTRWTYGSFEEAFGGLTVHEGVVYAPADEAVHAVDVEDGKRLWRTPIPEGSVQGPVAVAGGTVVAATSGTDLYALSAATGEPRWAGGFDRSHGPPTVAHGRVYVGVERRHTEPYGTATVRALDPGTGATEPVFATAGRGHPSVAATADGLVVAGTVTDPPDRPATTPMTTPGITETPGEDETPATDRAGDPKPARLYGLAPGGTERWSVALPAGRTLFSHPAVVDGTAYVGTAKGHLLAVDAGTGAVRWSVGTGDRYAGVRGPAVLDGAAFAGSDRGVFAFA